MRISVAIDRFLNQRQLESDWTDRSIGSYRNVLRRLTEPPPRGFGPEVRLDDFDSPSGPDKLRDHIGRNWGAASSGSRANVISIHHSFFGWALDEGFVDTDPSARVKRPPRRKPEVYRPPTVDQDLAANATTLLERGAWILMNEVGLRAATVVSVKWEHIDLTHGRIAVLTKGGHHRRFPLSPVALKGLRDVYRLTEPEPDDHVFTIERPLFEGNQRVRKVRDPKNPAGVASLRRMVQRVCVRAGVKPFGPHALRHGFANRFLRDSGRDAVSLQQLMGHANYATTQQYLDELKLEDLEEALRRASENRSTSVASPDETTSDYQPTGRFKRDGPGWSRTTARDQPGSEAGRRRTSDAPEAPLNDRKGVSQDG